MPNFSEYTQVVSAFIGVGWLFVCEKAKVWFSASEYLFPKNGAKRWKETFCAEGYARLFADQIRFPTMQK
jgi:hypothetical protein